MADNIAELYTRHSRSPVVPQAPVTQPAAPQTSENANANAAATPTSVE